MKISAIVCAYNEADFLPACLHSLFSQTRPPDEIIVVNNASSDDTAAVAARDPRRARRRRTGTRGWSSPARPARRHVDGRRAGLCRCRLPRTAAMAGTDRAAFRTSSRGRGGDRPVPVLRLGFGRPCASFAPTTAVVAPPTHVARPLLASRAGAILYGGNFAVRRDALDRIGGFDRSIEFHGEDTNLGRRLTPLGSIHVARECWIWTSARRYRAHGQAQGLRALRQEFLVRDPSSSSCRPKSHRREGLTCRDTNHSCCAIFTCTRAGATAGSRCGRSWTSTGRPASST